MYTLKNNGDQILWSQPRHYLDHSVNPSSHCLKRIRLDRACHYSPSKSGRNYRIQMTELIIQAYRYFYST